MGIHVYLKLLHIYNIFIIKQLLMNEEILVIIRIFSNILGHICQHNLLLCILFSLSNSCEFHEELSLVWCDGLSLRSWPWCNSHHRFVDNTCLLLIFSATIYICWSDYLASWLWPSDTIWNGQFRLTPIQVMACCLMTLSHYMEAYWYVLWYSTENNVTRSPDKHD